MKIISRYVVREHVGPLAFALTALTSLMLLNYIAKNFAHLVGKGLPAIVIAEFFALAVPFTVAMTLPMAVLVAVLYAFSRLAAENEVTAFKASGISMQRLMMPALIGGFFFSLVMIGFNDQLLPRANHRLATLQRDIFRTSPTFALKDQVINTIKEGQLYLRAGRISRGSGRMSQVELFDLTDPTRRRTIYADSGRIALASEGEDLYLTLYEGVMREVPTDRPYEVTELYYRHGERRVAGVAIQFEESTENDGVRGDREMSICEMQQRYRATDLTYQQARVTYRQALAESKARRGVAPPRAKFVPAPTGGIGQWYCELQRAATRVIRPTAAHAAVPGQDTIRARQDTAKAKQDSARQKQDTTKPKPDTARARLDSLRQDSVRRARADSAAAVPVPSTGTALPPTTAIPPGAGGWTPPASSAVTPPVGAIDSTVVNRPPGVAPPPGVARPGAVVPGMPDQAVSQYSPVRDAWEQLQLARVARNKWAVEIHKKFSLAAACLIFVLVGAPIALRFPRGGVGMVIGVSLGIFALSYVGLIGGEALADKGYLSPFWAMWAANVILTAIGIALMMRVGRENSSGRGGGLSEWLETRRARRASRA